MEFPGGEPIRERTLTQVRELGAVTRGTCDYSLSPTSHACHTGYLAVPSFLQFLSKSWTLLNVTCCLPDRLRKWGFWLHFPGGHWVICS